MASINESFEATELRSHDAIAEARHPIALMLRSFGKNRVARNVVSALVF
jgi:hypothetical protein